MVGTDREYAVVQWSGHAASITERFSGLLARQALVDVTLLCQNQELRVHKLVLASSSLYFEEILEEDLGQEPTIILNNLHFNILKAMIEFMYCGETKIAYCQLQSLLNAARVFKVKHLESLVNSILDTKIKSDCDSPHFHESTNEEENSLFSSLNNCTHFQSPDNDLEYLSQSTDIFEDSKISSDSATPEIAVNIEEQLEPRNCSLSQVQLSPKAEKPHDDQSDSPGGIGQCSRVYTHKKRKLLNKKKSSQFTPLKLHQLCDSLTTDYIDLSYDKNCDNSSSSSSSSSTINLETEYIFSLHSENIQSTCHLNSPNYSITDKHKSIYDDLNIHELTVSSYKNIRSEIKKLYSDTNQCNSSSSTPVLRRSVRLNQLENDDTVIGNNNQSINYRKTRDYKKLQKQQLKKLKKFSRIKSMRLNNGKNKNSESRVSDENRKHHANNSRSLKGCGKKIIKTPGKCSLSNEEHKSSNKNNPRDEDERIDTIESLNNYHNNNNNNNNSDYIPVKLNTIASVDRSLWGDMSDLLDNCHNNTVELSNNSQSKEIPFAVGLLPLRAALERMQAIPDYQPRKTRSSSVAPYKFDSCGVKRKANCSDHFESIVIGKKKYIPDDRAIDESDTVCHIHIHTSSQSSENKIIQAKPFMQIESTSDTP